MRYTITHLTSPAKRKIINALYYHSFDFSSKVDELSPIFVTDIGADKSKQLAEPGICNAFKLCVGSDVCVCVCLGVCAPL